MSVRVYYGDNLPFLRSFEAGSFDLIYIDPPFNTGKKQRLRSIKTRSDVDGDRVGFQDKRYSSEVVSDKAYDDTYDDYHTFIQKRLVEAYRVLSDTGSMFFHIDYREAHHCRLFLDNVFGEDSFMNEIIWAYDFGARSKKRWSTKHDTIYWYVKDPDNYTFNLDESDRIPYMAPSLVGDRKAARGKTPTDVWWHTIVPTNGAERTGYPTQKPRGIIDRIVRVHSNRGDKLLDFFAGSGTLGASASEHGRECVLIDNSEEAIDVIMSRIHNAVRVYC